MDPQLIVLACVLHTIEFGPPPDARCQAPYVIELTTAFQKYGRQYDVPPDVEAAKCYHESHFDKHARGTHGEIGICQPKPGGAIQGRDLKLSARQIENIDTNVRISTAYITTFVHECDTTDGWLTKYNRPARGCRRSRYSSGVLKDLRLAKALGRAWSSWSEAPPRALPSSPFLDSGTRETWSASELPGGTSRMPAASAPSTPSDTDERRPAGTRRVEPTWSESARPAPTEEELARPFQEP